MSHTSRCIRSDGDWICTLDCTHDRDEDRAREHALACAVADAWARLTQDDPDGSYRRIMTPYGVDDGELTRPLQDVLDALERATRSSLLRKVRP